MRIAVASALLALSISIPTAAQPTQSTKSSKSTKSAKSKRPPKSTKSSKSTKPKQPTPASLQASGSGKLGIGIFDGLGTLRVDDGFVEGEARGTPSYGTRDLRVAAPLRIGYRRPFSLSFTEFRASADLELRWRLSSRLRIQPQVGLVAASRPNWLDPYQPAADGSLGTTDRNSYWERHWGGRLVFLPARRHRTTLSYEYRLFDYRADPNFDPVLAPTHLVPRDHDEHAAFARWEGTFEHFRLGFTTTVEHRQDFFAFARDRGTGRTHAAPGGAPPNPLASYWGVEPELRGGLMFGKKRSVTIDLTYAHLFWVDTFQGYYSYQEPRAMLDVHAEPGGPFSIDARAQFRYRRYGPDSYAPGPNHPALEEGSRLVDSRLNADLTLGYALGEIFELYANARVTLRRSNYPDYVAYVFPATRAYNIDWDYDNVETSAGARVRFGSAPD